MRLGIVIAMTLAAVFVAPVHASVQRRCVPPRGPGDGAIHSDGLRVAHITCVAGRRVALACVRFSYGRSGICRAAGERWRCTSTKPTGSTSVERCTVGRMSMRIRWLD
jgi:hypothetical protein